MSVRPHTWPFFFSSSIFFECSVAIEVDNSIEKQESRRRYIGCKLGLLNRGRNSQEHAGEKPT